MADKSIENWQKLLKAYHESCGGESPQHTTDYNFDKASISDDLHVMVNSGYININEVKGIYTENDRAILKLPDKKYVEVREGSKNLEVNIYHEAEITEMEFERDNVTIHPNKVTFKDNKGGIFNLDVNTSQYKSNLGNFIKL